MDKLLSFLQQIDWEFGAAIVIGGYFWGRKYFQPLKNPAHNFLLLATLFGFMYILLQIVIGEFKLGNLLRLFITYLVFTSLYDLFIKALLCRLENVLKKWRAKDESL